MEAPELVTQVASAFSTTTTPKETAEISVKAGDVLVAAAVSEENLTSLVISGGTGVTWTQQEVVSIASNSFHTVYTGACSSETSFKPKCTKTGGTFRFGFSVQQWRKSGGIGQIGKANATGAPSLSFTTKQASSAVVMSIADWAAKTGAVTYRTVQSKTFTQKSRIEETTFYCVDNGYYAEIPKAEAGTYGASAPTEETYSIILIEVKGEEGAGTKEGKAAIIGQGVVAAKGIATHFGVAPLTGHGVIAAKGVVTKEGKASLTGTGTIVAAGTVESPSPITGESAGSITETGATLKVTYTEATKVFFEYGTSEAYGTKVEGGKSKEAPFATKAITGLTPGTTYHYRAVVETSSTFNGEDKTFSTTSGTFSGKASIHGTGVVGAKGIATNLGKPSIAGHGIVAAAGSVLGVFSGKAAISGHGVVAAKGTVTGHETFEGKAALTGAASIRASGFVIRIETGLSGITFPQPEFLNEPLSVAVSRKGTVIGRWGPDEWNAENIPQSLAYGSTAPGGDKSASLVLPRQIDKEYPDLELFDDIEILRPGAECVWGGRIAQLPRTHGLTYSINVGAVGHQASLTDDPTFKALYIDRDISSWSSPSSTRSINLRAAGYAPQQPTTGADATSQLPALELIVTGSWNGVTPIQEPIYDAGPGLKVGYLYAEWVLNTGDPTFLLEASTAPDDTIGTISQSGGDLAGGGTASVFTWEPVPQRVLIWQWYYGSNVAGGQGSQYTALIRRAAVHGDHGLTRRGSGGENTEGYYASDIINHVLSQTSTGLEFGLGTTIQETTFSIPHIVFKEGTTAARVIEAANAYHQWEWLVQNKRFIYREPNSERLCWEARRSDGAQVNLEGDLAEGVYNGVFVQFTDTAGVSRSAGPTGSNAEYISAALEDNSETNPVNLAGIRRRWAVLQISQVTTEAGAIQLGAAYLAQTSLPQRRGSISLQGFIRHPQKGRMAVTQVRAGDWLRISDITADVPRRIVEAQYNHVTKTLECQLDNTSVKVEAILERLGITNVGTIG